MDCQHFSWLSVINWLCAVHAGSQQRVKPSLSLFRVYSGILLIWEGLWRQTFGFIQVSSIHEQLYASPASRNGRACMLLMAMGLHSSWNGDERFEEWDLRLRERVEGIMYFYKWWVAAQFITVHLSLPHDKEIPGMAQKPECWGLAKKKKRFQAIRNFLIPWHLLWGLIK